LISLNEMMKKAFTLALALMLLCSFAARADKGDGAAIQMPEDETVAEAQSAATGDRLSAESVVTNNKASWLKSFCVFSNESGRIRVPTKGLTGFANVWSKDGARTEDWKITCDTGALCALIRIGYTHHAAVRVTARRSSWPAAREDETVYLWIPAYGSTKPAIVPVDTAPTVFERGDIVSFETGIPFAQVELTDEQGETVTTADADENGLAVFDSAHSADGQDHCLSVTHSYGRYDYHIATAYASDPANLLPAAGGTGTEWVANNDCATYQSRILTAAGFPVYCPYTQSASSPGGSLVTTLSTLIGAANVKKEFTIDDFHEGDIVWGHSMGHAMYCSAVNREEGTIHTYAHSTKADSPLSDNGWTSIENINAVAQMVTEETHQYSYRVDGVADPRQITFADEENGETQAMILQAGVLLPLPDCMLTVPEGKIFTGWLLDGTLHAPGEEFTVDGHMVFTAQWTDAILLGIADLMLPESTRIVEDGAFEGIDARSVYIPDGCTLLSAHAFQDCRQLRAIRIPAGCAVDASAFDGCEDVTVFGALDSPAQHFCEVHEGFRFREAPDAE